MKEYPKIPNSKDFPLGQCITFEKYDGSNIRAEWTKKKGFHKFGTRTRLFNESDPDFGCAIPIILETYSECLSKIFIDNNLFKKIDNITIFTEFFGEHSFGGLHLPSDKKEVILFDVWIYKFGLLGPEVFVKTFENIKSAKVIYIKVNLTETLLKILEMENIRLKKEWFVNQEMVEEIYLCAK
jgi:hypothetical protein